jgi:hypothetical protein
MKQWNQFMRTYSKVILPILLLHAAAPLVFADPMGTAFNYQGYFTYQGNAANGPYDIQFKLYDAPNNGNPRGTVTYAPANVDKGLFTTNIDFGGIFDGNAYWLEIGVRPFKNNPPPYDWKPRLQIRPVPYALFASNAATATTATTAITANGVSANAVSAAGIAASQVVKSLNGLHDDVTLVAGANVTLTPNNNKTITIDSSSGASGWSLTGNAGTTAGVNFMGTTDDKPLELRANGQPSLKLQYATTQPSSPNAWENGINVAGGFWGNFVNSSYVGGTIAGGGYYQASFIGTFDGPHPNYVGGNFGTVGGGYDNIAYEAATVPGGYGNEAKGRLSFAAGKYAAALHDGCFVWNDSTAFQPYRIGGGGGEFVGGWVYDNPTTGPNQFRIKASGGVRLSPSTSLYWGNSPLGPDRNSQLVPDQGGAIELGNSFGYGNIPYIDFHFGVGEYQDFNVRLINDADQLLSCYGNLNVSGSASVCTLTIRGGCDLAEPFQMSQDEIPKGSVVIIDAEHPGKLKLSTEPYDTRVAGIISGAGGVQPGIQMSQKGTLEGTENVALSGRVYVLADASDGAIKPGDLLTTSPTPGHAMKVTDHARAQGAILGKAMSALSGGKGIVLVLVTLQ